MTQEQLEKKAQEYADGKFPLGFVSKGIHHKTTAKYGYLAGYNAHVSELANEAINFADWIARNGYKKSAEYGVWIIELKSEKTYYKEVPMTTSELLELFRKE